tara:strand:+ start:434 stop:556 length:123 start_codon:yes stop_codon:yes gene_type:complete
VTSTLAQQAAMEFPIKAVENGDEEESSTSAPRHAKVESEI